LVLREDTETIYQAASTKPIAQILFVVWERVVADLILPLSDGDFIVFNSFLVDLHLTIVFIEKVVESFLSLRDAVRPTVV
jgi:hypothetical protein